MFENITDEEYVKLLISACDEMTNSPYLNSNLHIEKISNIILRDGKRKIVYQLLASLRNERAEVYEKCVDMIQNYSPLTNIAEFKDENPAFIFSYVIYLLANIASKKIRLSEFLINVIDGDDMQHRYMIFCSDIIVPFTTVLAEIGRLSTNYDVCRAYLFSERMPYRDDLMSDTNYNNAESDTVDTILGSLISFSATIKSTKSLKPKQKRQIGSMIESMLYTYQTFKDFKSLCYAYTSFKEVCPKLKKPLRKELADIDMIFDMYIRNYPTGPENIFEEIENKAHAYERKK